MGTPIKQIKLTATASGTVDIPLDVGRYDNLRAQLNVTAATGTSPTLDVVIQDTLDGSNYNGVITFAQKTAAGREVLNSSATFGKTLRVSYTIGGGTPSFDFTLDLIAK